MKGWKTALALGAAAAAAGAVAGEYFYRFALTQQIDLFYTPDGRIVFNEVNTIPGFTEHSRFPGMMRGAGVEFGPLVERLLEQAVADV